ncbi:Ms5788A family Cys-rich leader peptide [Actinomadura violacea]|uniref:Ms5788A family Cys-rich leader peptide n=1 Tax=Actinomadura violacea TaxID=2819934 RepID=UPI003555CAD6
MTWDKTHVTVSEGETDVTGRGLSAYHRAVRYWTEQMLTKRRAVDFCRVAASLCRPA